jgi:hypothetical protein
LTSDFAKTLGFYVASCVLLLYPALLNGFPLLFPDSMEYIYAGDDIVAYFRGSGFRHFGLRSEVFSLSVLPLHLYRSLWPIVIVNALITVWTLYQVMDRRRRVSLAVIGGLALLTPLSWHVSRAMPDYQAGLVALWGFLLISDRKLSSAQMTMTALLYAYGILSHGSHLLVSVCLMVATLGFTIKHRRAGLIRLSVTTLAAIVFQLCLSTGLYGRPHLFNPGAPPFLLCRVLADGTGVQYLKDHPEHPLAEHIELISDDAESNLWSPIGLRVVLMREHPEKWDLVRKRQLSFVARVTFSYPVQQLKISFWAVLRQLYLCRLDDFEPNGFIQDKMEEKFPYWLEPYQDTRQYRKQLPLEPHRALHLGVLILSLICVLGLFSTRSRELTSDEKLLACLVFLIILFYSAITGIISVPNARYGSRAIWLVPFLAIYLIWRTRKAR